MNIFVAKNDDTRIVQAMRVPDLWDIEGRTDFDFWICSIRGACKVKWSGTGMKIEDQPCPVGTWVVYEVTIDDRRILGITTDKSFRKLWVKVQWQSAKKPNA